MYMSKDFQDEYKLEVETITKDVVSKIEQLASKNVEERRKNVFKQETLFVDELKQRHNNTEKQQKVLVVIATPKTLTEYKDSEEFNALSKIVFDNTITNDKSETEFFVEIDIVAENREGLPKVYNKYIDIKYQNYIVCFIHDDVTIYDNHFYEKLTESHKHFPVVGLAGATKFNLPFRIDTPTAWHTLSTETKGKGVVKHQSGFVAHQQDDKKWSTFFGMVPQQIKLMDGLCMSFQVSACLESGFKFDEDFQFHHYDLSASIRCKEAGLNITTTDIFVLHKGIGVMDDSWKDSHRKFVKKYQYFLG